MFPKKLIFLLKIKTLFASGGEKDVFNNKFFCIFFFLFIRDILYFLNIIYIYIVDDIAPFLLSNSHIVSNPLILAISKAVLPNKFLLYTF